MKEGAQVTNAIISIPSEIATLENLRVLKMRANRITGIPDTLSALKDLREFDLNENPLPKIPPEILDRSSDPQRIINFLVEIQRSDRLLRLNEAKLILVGQGSVGKTSLSKRIMEGTFDSDESKTDGIAINRWKLAERGQDDLQINIWDFGGQEIMHSTHQFFLTKRSLYVVVIDARQGEHENRLEYWLKMVESFGAASPTIVVINKLDQHALEINRRGLLKKYPFVVNFLAVSCKTGFGIEELRRALNTNLRKLEHLSDIMPNSWSKIKGLLGDMKQDYISFESYRNLCRTHGLSEEKNQDYLIDLLHDLGIVVNFREDIRLRNTNVLNPEWVTQGVYKLLNSYSLFNSKGVLSVDAMGDILDGTRYPKDCHLFLINLMEKFELCFEMEDSNHREYLIPDLLQKEEPALNWDYEGSLGFQFHYDVLPASIVLRLIVKLNHLILQKTYWRSGAMFSEGQNLALVKSDEEEGVIYIWVGGPKDNRRYFLEVIRQARRSINRSIPKLRVAEKVPFRSVVVDYQHLLALESMGERVFVPEGLKQKADVKALLKAIDPRAEDWDDEARSNDSTKLRQGSTEGTVFISYSHKDHRQLMRLRAHLAPLEREYGLEVWDDQQIKVGSRWRDEIERALERASVAVLLVSADFLASEFIVTNELPAILSRQHKLGLSVMPLIIKPCRFGKDKALSAFQAVNDPARPVSDLSASKQEAFYAKIAADIEGRLQRRFQNDIAVSRSWSLRDAARKFLTGWAKSN